MNNTKKLSHILVKPSGPDCNMACSYCFYSDKSSYFGTSTKHRMSLDVLEVMTRKSLRRPGQTMSFGWQGGEPTLMGVDFFRKAVELQRIFGQGMQVSNSFQTNGLLIDEEWVSFLKENRFLVGLSLDGPEHIHDHHRVTKSGRGSHQLVEKSARALLATEVETNALSVVTSYSAAYASETYHYLKSLGFRYLQFIPCLEVSSDHSSTKLSDFSVTPAQYGAFLCELFDLWASDFVDSRPTTSIRLFESFACVYLSLLPADCSARKTCGEYLVVEHDGKVFSCDFFVNDEWLLGNIRLNEPEQMLNSPQQTLFGDIKAQLHEKCLNCRWRRFCQGGCTKHRLCDSAGRLFNHFCESYEIFFRYADFRFRILMENFVARHHGLG